MAFSSKLNLRIVLLTSLAIGLSIHGICQGQTEDEKRQSPAPWRPSFGSLNKNAIQPGVENSQNLNLGANRNTQPNAPRAGNPVNNLKSDTPTSRSNASPTSTSTNPASVNQNASSGSANQRPSIDPSSISANKDLRQSNRPISRTGGLARVSKTFDKLPNQAGQVWREYDISPYTSRITTSEEPQKAVLDWVLRETGTEMWFNEPMGLLHINKNKLFVYHTPEIQAVVKQIVDRFVWTRGQVQNIDINLVTVENPNWRSQSYTMLQPIDVKSPGVEAWMISKENAAILLAQLRKRGDYKEHSGGRLTNHDGQVFSLEKTQPVQFVRSLRWVPNQAPNYQPLMTSLDEGYRLTISSLSSIDNESIEAIIKCDVDQVEKLSTVKVNVPGVTGAAEQLNLQIPQLVSWRLHERFRWPNDQVLLLSCGVVATPEPHTSRSNLKIPGLGIGLGQKIKRADALLFVDYRGPASEAAVPLTAGNQNNVRSMAPIQRRR